jgi:hypothetical protein
VCLLELAQVAAFQNQSLARDPGQKPHDMKTVAGGFQNKPILSRRVLLRPAPQMSHGQLVEYFFGDGCRRSGPPEQRGREGIGVSV